MRVALEAEGDGYALTVTDNGPGFDAQAGSRNSGLTMVKALTLQLDGTLDFGAAPGGGALVRLHLPAAVCEPPAAAPVAAQGAMPGPVQGATRGTGSPLPG